MASFPMTSIPEQIWTGKKAILTKRMVTQANRPTRVRNIWASIPDPITTIFRPSARQGKHEATRYHLRGPESKADPPGLYPVLATINWERRLGKSV
ncbi:hypothetical protein HYALB_00000093 [Hymenoscyphus albidus]|uniref:Uncharacterized protein n=1 Tax=Hymenoscyphus albidus TaxID=595503 RepID=A0A9N9LHQ6_9HELO|nr:hypothetical protein HYALB_00000093 [Hymenoscyphus albidus]